MKSGRIILKKLHWFSALLVIFHINFACGQMNYDEKLQSMYRNTVPIIKSDELAGKMGKTDVIILDTRSSAEYQVSHIEGAIFVDYDRFDLKDVSNLSKEKEVVVYCAVGYRSERIGEKLQKAGFNQVSNLYGGIFDWKNNGYDVVNEEGVKTDSVHTYNRRWSVWLKNGIKVYE